MQETGLVISLLLLECIETSPTRGGKGQPRSGIPSLATM